MSSDRAMVCRSFRAGGVRDRNPGLKPGLTSSAAPRRETENRQPHARRRALHSNAAIHCEDLAGDVSCFRACEKGYSGGDFVTFSEPAQRNVIQ